MRTYPGGWRPDNQFTVAEIAAAAVILERQRRRDERNKPLCIDWKGESYGRLYWFQQRLMTQQGPHSYEELKECLTKQVRRVRISWGLYFCVTDFERAWQKRLTARHRKQKKRGELLPTAIGGA